MKRTFLTFGVLFTLVSNLSWAFGCFSTTKEPEAIVKEEVVLITGDILTLKNQTTTGMDPLYVTYSHSGKFLSVANSTINGSISVYKVKKDSLEPIQEIGAGINPNYLSYAPNDTFLAVANLNVQPNGRGSLIVYKADCKEGTLSRLQTLQAPTNPEILNPFAVTYSPDGRFAAVSNKDSINNSPSILVYRVHPVSGNWQLVQSFPLIFDPDVNFPSPWELQYSPDGRFLTVVLNDPDMARTFDVDPVTGELSNPQDTIVDLFSPTGIAYSHSGRFAAVTNFNAQIVTYEVNSATGTLVRTTQAPVASTPGTFPYFIAYSSDDLVAAVTNRIFDVGTGTVTVYCVDQETGEFTPSPVQTISNLQDPVGIDFAPCSSFATVTERRANKVLIYKVENEICTQ